MLTVTVSALFTSYLNNTYVVLFIFLFSRSTIYSCFKFILKCPSFILLSASLTLSRCHLWIHAWRILTMEIFLTFLSVSFCWESQTWGGIIAKSVRDVQVRLVQCEVFLSLVQAFVSNSLKILNLFSPGISFSFQYFSQIKILTSQNMNFCLATMILRIIDQTFLKIQR